MPRIDRKNLRFNRKVLIWVSPPLCPYKHLQRSSGMFMSGIGSKCNNVLCPKYGDKVDLKTCMLCTHYKKFLFKSKCCWKIENAAHFLKKSFAEFLHPKILVEGKRSSLSNLKYSDMLKS